MRQSLSPKPEHCSNCTVITPTVCGDLSLSPTPGVIVPHELTPTHSLQDQSNIRNARMVYKNYAHYVLGALRAHRSFQCNSHLFFIFSVAVILKWPHAGVNGAVSFYGRVHLPHSKNGGRGSRRLQRQFSGPILLPGMISVGCEEPC